MLSSTFFYTFIPMIFVTGATGLVGSHILVELAKSSTLVKALRRQSSNVKEVEQIFEYYFGSDWQSKYNQIEWIEGELSDVVFLEEVLENVTEVIHTAALVSFKPNDKSKMYKTNVEGTFNLVNVCLSAGVRKFCHVSSTASIGRTKTDYMLNENNIWKDSPDNSYYAITKYKAEQEVWRGIEEGLDAVIINPCIILGPANWEKGSAAMFKRASKGVKFYTSGGNAFVDVRDVAKIAIHLLQSSIKGERFLTVSENDTYQSIFDKILGEYNLPKASIKATKLMTEIAWRADYLKSTFGGKTILTKETAHSSQWKRSYSNQKIKEAINWEFISVDDAVKNAVDYFKKYYSSN